MAISKLRLGPVELASGVYATAAGLIIAGLAINDPRLERVSLLAYAIAGGLMLWGTTINRRHLWQSWWRGPPNPFKVKAWSGAWDYDEGSDVGGIRWHKAFAQVRVNLTNVSQHVLEDLAVRLAPEQPIVDSRAHCQFAECRIGSEFEPVDITLRARLKDGRVVDIPPSQQQRISFGHPHQLFCERLPAGATIEINLATVVPNEPGSEHPFKPERSDPEYVDLAMKWRVDDGWTTATGRFALRRDDEKVGRES